MQKKSKKFKLDKFVLGNLKHKLFEKKIIANENTNIDSLIAKSLKSENISHESKDFKLYLDEMKVFANDLKRFMELYIGSGKKIKIGNENEGRFVLCCNCYRESYL